MDKRKSNHVKGIEAWEDKKKKAREQLTGYQAKKKPLKPNNPVNEA